MRRVMNNVGDDEKEEGRIIVDTVPEMRSPRMVHAYDQYALDSYFMSGMSSVEELACSFKWSGKK